MAKQVLQENLEWVGQGGQVEGRAQGGAPENLILLATYGKRRAGIEGVGHDGATCADWRVKARDYPRFRTGVVGAD